MINENKSISMKNLPRAISKLANSIARKHNYGFATEIILGDCNKVVSHTSYGYRKKSNDQYVPMAYVNKGWSSVYYQNAETTVMIDKDYYNKIMRIFNIT